MRFSLKQNKQARLRVELPASILGEDGLNESLAVTKATYPVITAKGDRNKGLEGQDELWDCRDSV